jgi:outer membrane protein assembly factor BamB
LVVIATIGGAMAEGQTRLGDPRRRSLAITLSALLLVLSACDWAVFRSDPAHTGSSADTSISADALRSGGLHLDWTATAGSAVVSSPAVAGGVVYVGSSDGDLYAFDANGTQQCAGVPKGCEPLWRGLAPGIISYASPAVVEAVVYIASAAGVLYAFDAQGTAGCGGSPRTCVPLWTASLGNQGGHNIFSSPTVANGVVYIGSNDNRLYAFDAAGTTNCAGSPKTCAPLWTAPTSGAPNDSPAVASGTVYVGAGTKLYAFDASGTTGCSGLPKSCAPLWTAAINGCCPIFASSSPAVAGGTVFIGSENGSLYAFDAAGTTNCLGTPKTCLPLWRGASRDYLFSSPAVADGVVYAASYDGYLRAYDAAGITNCSGTPKICKRLWRAYNGNTNSSPAMANGVIYLGGHDGHTLKAFDTSGNELWSTILGGEVDSSPAVANGSVYVGAGDGKVYAFRL